MKTLKMLVMALLMAAVINTTQAAATTKSPNGFINDQCTYGVDVLTDAYKWRLKFSQSYGRDAKWWPEMITNGTRTTNPQAEDIMVLDSSELGHVAWVWYRSEEWVLIIHTNMKVGTDLFTYGGATFRYAWFRYQGKSTVQCWDNGKTYSLKAFVTMR